LSSIHRNCSSSNTNVANAGVLYVWLASELSRAIPRSSDAGIQRDDALIDRIRSIAAGRTCGQPQPAVTGEALLRSEVVDVDLAGRPRQPTRPRRWHRRPPTASPDGRRRSMATPGRRLVVGEGDDVDAVTRRLDVWVASRSAADDDRIGQMRGVLRRLEELRRELTEDVVLTALLDQSERGDVPEHRRAAVAQHDLPAVGQREQFGETGADTADEVLRPAACRCELPSRLLLALARASACSGLIFDGPQPKRPSLGSIAWGMSSMVGAVVTGPVSP
jgi:hypothetical protein